MLRITDIGLRDFRSYERLDLPIEGRLTILVGPNAIGKTNIIEAIQLLTAGYSFRRAKTVDILRAGTSAARASIQVTDGNRQLELALALDERTRKFTLNGKPKRSTDMRGIVPSVTFTPDDLDLLKGSPAARRDAIDALGIQLNRNYQVILQDFEKVLKHKNRLLKDGQVGMLDAVNDLYIKVGAQLQNYRSALFARILPKIAAHYSQIATGEVLDGEYIPSGQDDLHGEAPCAETPYAEAPYAEASCEEVSHVETSHEAATRQTASRTIDSEMLRAAVERHKEDEVAARRTLVGPSRDRFTFTIGGLDAGRFASQGQQRSAVLAWKLAEADTMEEMIGTFPVLLLDDVMSELDEVRRTALVAYLQRETQAFITTANLEYFDASILEAAQVVHLPL